MKALYLRALFATGVLSAGSYSALESIEAKATASAAHALDPETDKKILRTDAATVAEQEERGGPLDLLDVLVGMAFRTADTKLSAATAALPSLQPTVATVMSAPARVSKSPGTISYLLPASSEELKQLVLKAEQLLSANRYKYAGPPRVHHIVERLNQLTPIEAAAVIQAVKMLVQKSQKEAPLWVQKVEDVQLRRIYDDDIRPEALRSSWLASVQQNGAKDHDHGIDRLVIDATDAYAKYVKFHKSVSKSSL
ncbi:unnamed protein product [Hyaloperonospora brassicae]|uniref:RxLR effector candidate protein n=1 Tax=Hyaloperonospora brassicae TaxID=162125 RepID=A0AAV0V4Z3_HYABA|nr:unnamed protein product [Hyaloperonospora brassicae]